MISSPHPSSVNPSPEAQAWDRFVASSPAGHVLQSWPWGQLKAAFGWRAERLALEREGHIVAGAQVLFRPLPLGLGTIAYVPKGPVADWADGQTVRRLLDAIHALARRRGALFLKIEPDLPDEPGLARQLRGYGFRPSRQSIQPRRTILIDLRPEPAAILAAMKSKTRYNVRLAGRKGVVIREGTAADLPAFHRLIVLTGQRDSFGVHSRAYYDTAFRLFVPEGLARLFLADFEGRTIAALMAFACGDKAWYMYGASSGEERQRMPNYALQWAAIQWARERGCRTYDLWGVPDEDEATLEAEFPQRHDGLWGVYRFKRGFGGRVVRYVGAWDYVYRPPLYALYDLALRWR